MVGEFNQALEQDMMNIQEKRARFNQSIQELAALLEERRKEADGDNIDTEKLDKLSAQVESFIAQLSGEDEVVTATAPKQEVKPYSNPFA